MSSTYRLEFLIQATANIRSNADMALAEAVRVIDEHAIVNPDRSHYSRHGEHIAAIRIEFTAASAVEADALMSDARRAVRLAGFTCDSFRVTPARRSAKAAR